MWNDELDKMIDTTTTFEDTQKKIQLIFLGLDSCLRKFTPVIFKSWKLDMLMIGTCVIILDMSIQTESASCCWHILTCVYVCMCVSSMCVTALSYLFWELSQWSAACIQGYIVIGWLYRENGVFIICPFYACNLLYLHVLWCLHASKGI